MITEKIPLQKILYISNVDASESLYHSQVIPHVHTLREYYDVQFLVLNRKAENRYRQDFIYKYKSVKGDFSYHIARRNFSKQATALNAFIKTSNPDLIYSRGIRGGLVGGFIKKRLLKNDTKLLNDVRGDAIDENKYNFFKSSLLSHSNRKIYQNTDILFLVSHFLKNKICNLYQFDKSKAFVFPTFVPNKKFDFNKKHRVAIRHTFNFKKDDIVLVYAGNLARHQNADTILSAFARTTNDKLKLLFLTRDDRIWKLIKKYKIDKNKLVVESVDYDIIQKYYHAADAGLLIRDNTDTNKSAAPTKFSEYVNSGLFLILTFVEADYLRTFKKKKLNGVLLQNKNELKNYFDKLTCSDIHRNNMQINTLKDLVGRQRKILEK